MKVLLQDVFPLLYTKKYKVCLLHGNKPNLMEHILNEVQDTDVRFLRTQDTEFWHQFIELCTPTLFNVGRVIIVIQDVPERKFSAYQPILKTLPDTVQLIFTSSSFRQSSTWVKNFQKSTEWAISASYELSLEQSIVILKRCLAKYHVPLSASQIKMVAQWVQEGDWVSTAKTLHLLYHSKHKAPIQQEDLEQLFHHLGLDSQEIFLPFLENPDIRMMQHLQNQDQQLKWIRAWQKLAWQCWQLKVALESLETHTQAPRAQHITTLATQLDPPIFFKYLPFIKEKIDVWSLDWLSKLMNRLYDLEVEFKKGTFGDQHQISVYRTMMQPKHKALS
jgi:hypothetical protein